jgi:CheY-like chemotaxis protein
MNRPRILMADDHRIVAEGLRSLLEPDFELIEIVEDGVQLVAAAKRLAPDIILADITMPRLNGLEALEQFERQIAEQRSFS